MSRRRKPSFATYGDYCGDPEIPRKPKTPRDILRDQFKACIKAASYDGSGPSDKGLEDLIDMLTAHVMAEIVKGRA